MVSWIKVVNKEEKKRYFKRVNYRVAEVSMKKENNKFLIEYIVLEDYPDSRRIVLTEGYDYRKTKTSAKHRFNDIIKKIDKKIFSKA